VNPTATGGTANITQPPLRGINKNPQPGSESSKAKPKAGAANAEIAQRSTAQSSSGSNPIDEPLKAETMTSAPADKEQSISEAKAVHKNHPNLDHLSAPASAIQSGTATPAPELVGESGATATHRGSEVKDLPADEIKEVENATALREEDGEEDSAMKGVQAMQLGEGTKVQEQSAADGEDAGKSVED